MLYAQIERFGEAESEYQTAIKLQPSFVPAYLNLSDLYRMKGKDDDRERLPRRALKLSPQNARVYHALCLLLVRKKQMPEAIGALEKSAKLKTDNPDYSHVYAVALNTFGKPVEAIEVLKVAHTQHPDDREVL